MRFFAVATAALFIPLGANAQVFKCVDPSTGQASYSDEPCQGKEVGGSITVVPNTVDTSGSQQQTMPSDEGGSADGGQSSDAQPDADVQEVDTAACDQAQRAYEYEAGAVRRDEAAVAARRSAMYGTCATREPPRDEVRAVVPPRAVLPDAGAVRTGRRGE